MNRIEEKSNLNFHLVVGYPSLSKLFWAREKVVLTSESFIDIMGIFGKKSKNGFLFFVWGKSDFGISGMFLAVTFRHENTSDSLKLVSFVSLRISSGAPTWAGSGLFYNCT